MKNINSKHCVKSVRFRSYSGSHFPVFGLNMEKYSVSLQIQSKCEKMRTRTTSNSDTFYAVKGAIFKKKNSMKGVHEIV